MYSIGVGGTLTLVQCHEHQASCTLRALRNLPRYDLKPDVRQSLYDYCDQWVEAIGSDRTFMGGAEPNLADLVSRE